MEPRAVDLVGRIVLACGGTFCIDWMPRLPGLTVRSTISVVHTAADGRATRSPFCGTITKALEYVIDELQQSYPGLV